MFSLAHSLFLSLILISSSLKIVQVTTGYSAMTTIVLEKESLLILQSTLMWGPFLYSWPVHSANILFSTNDKTKDERLIN